MSNDPWKSTRTSKRKEPKERTEEERCHKVRWDESFKEEGDVFIILNSRDAEIMREKNKKAAEKQQDGK